MELAREAMGYDPSDMLAGAVTARLTGVDSTVLADTITFDSAGPSL